MAERQLGPFLLGPKLGGGGMGVVYRATYRKTGQEVALKLLPGDLSENPRLVARFERELEILKKLRHPNIVPCFGGGKLGSQRFFAMELVEGGSLAAEMKKRGGKLPWEDAVRYGKQICAALEHAHEHAIIHRDLKPANLLVSQDGRLKLADFGIARDIDATGLTATGRTVGTFAYMAPEQIRGEPPVSNKTDLYALGCVLFELLTGHPPFDAPTAPEIMFQHVEKKPPRVSAVALDCPIWLDALVGQLLEKDPAQRPRDATSVLQALIEVEQKVAERASLSLHAVSGSPTALQVTAETDQVRKLLKKKKKRKAETGPFWERTWFLVSCLAGVVGLVGWLIWPPGEDQLFAQAETLMQSADPIDWKRAYDGPVASLRKRFPEGAHAQDVRRFADQWEMHIAEERLRNNLRLGRDPGSEAERLYAEARRYDQFGDVITALEQYKGMVELLQGDEEARPFLNLARREINRIESTSGSHQDRRQIVENALAEAERAWRSDQVLEARKKWESIVTLYAGRRELEPLVQRARDRLAGREAGERNNEEVDRAH